MAGAGYWMAASHLSRACGRQRRWGRVQRETEIERVTRGIGVLESAWKLRMHGRAAGREGMSEEDLEGLRESIIGIP